MEGGDGDLGYMDSESEDSDSDGEDDGADASENTTLLPADASRV
eukprot:SAG22_NODE_547_length_9252_cov_27.855894_7_plen_44_part_00